jgi:hypothetical protein
MDFIYLYKIEKQSLTIVSSGVEKGLRGREWG